MLIDGIPDLQQVSLSEDGLWSVAMNRVGLLHPMAPVILPGGNPIQMSGRAPLSVALSGDGSRLAAGSSDYSGRGHRLADHIG